MGVTSDIFNSRGIIPHVKDRLKTWHSGIEIICEMCLISLELIPSIPQLLLDFIVAIISSISLFEVLFRNIDF
jgi:hypothetical protein